jgi:ABC-type multidrug transport system fused ATPase/permease subunit
MLNYIKRIASLIGERKKFVPFLVLLFLFNTSLDLLGLSLIVPFISILSDPTYLENSSYLIELNSLFNVTNHNQTILLLCVILLVMFFLKLIFSILVNYAILRFSFNTLAYLKIKLMSGYQNMNYSDFLKRNSSEYIQSLLDFSGIFNGSVLMPALRLMAELIICAGILIFLATSQGISLLILLSLITIFGLSFDFFTRKRLKNYGQFGAAANELSIQSVNEAMQGFKEIRVLGKEESFFKDLELGAKGNSKYAILSSTIGIMPRYILEFIIILFIVSLVYLASSDTFFEVSSIIPTIAVFGVASIRLLPSTGMVMNAISTIRLGQYATDRLYSDLVKLDNINVKRSNKIKKFNFNSLELKNVYFKYDNSEKWAIRDLSLKINAGESIGIVGTSGSGKTTLVDLILGLLDIDQGEILINERPVSENLELLRSRSAYLPQEIFITDNSLKKNIALGINEEDIDEKKILESIKKSSLESFVESLEEGIETKLGDKGVRLSGGQRQRVAIARSFYHERDLLIMDESTSALDSSTERVITQQIDQLKGSKTIIIIAHRESTLDNCDRVIELQNGILKS